MSLNCSSCGAALLPATSFCRQCGAALSQSEQPTAIFPPTVLPSSQQRQTLRWSIIASILSVLLICVVGGAWLLAMRGGEQTVPVYPGARTVVDMKYGDGSRALQLETHDSLSQVENWYSSNLKLDKTMRLTEGSVVLISDNKTITLVSEDNKTSVLIKMTP